MWSDGEQPLGGSLKPADPSDGDPSRAGPRALALESDPASTRGDAGDALRLRAESQLAELESIYRATPVGLCAVDTELRYVRANEEYAQIVGRSLDDIVGRSMHDVVHERARQPAVRLAQRVLATGQPVWNAELPGVSREAPPQERIWLVNVQPFGEGSRRGALAALQNITAVKQAERLAVARLRALEAAHRSLEREIAQRRLVEEKQQLLLRELDHRVKNTLASVQAMAEQSLTSSSSLESFRESFRGRIGAMARLHEALAGERPAGLDLRRLVEMVVVPFDLGGRLCVAGAPRIVAAEALRTLGMALHELATNAAKHGALSVEGGRVEVSWVEEEGTHGERGLVLRWSESGGPSLVPPSRRGFGTTFIEDGLQHELGTPSRIEFRPEGLRCEISVPCLDREV